MPNSLMWESDARDLGAGGAAFVAAPEVRTIPGRVRRMRVRTPALHSGPRTMRPRSHRSSRRSRWTRSPLPRAGLVGAITDGSPPRSECGSRAAAVAWYASDSVPTRSPSGWRPARQPRAGLVRQSRPQYSGRRTRAEQPGSVGGLERAYQEMQDHDADAAAACTRAIDLQPSYYAPLVDW